MNNLNRSIFASCLVVFLGGTGFAQGSLKLDKTTLIAQTRTLEVKFERGAIVSIQNRLTNEQYILRPGERFFNLNQTDPVLTPLTPGDWTLSTDDSGVQQATVLFTDATRRLEYTVRLGEDDEIVLRTSGKSETPGVVSLTWGIFGMATNPGRLIVPGQTGTYFDENDRFGVVGLDYPVHWEHQMAVYEGKLGSLLIYCSDGKPRYKRLNGITETGALDLAFETFSVAPFGDATEVPVTEWRIAGFEGNWRQPAERYKQRMLASHDFVSATGNREWIKEIRAVAMVFVTERNLLDRLAKELIPSKTLIHFVDWRKDPFDFNYPDYTPSTLAKDFVDHAHELGFRVMLHTNLLGISELHPEYQNFREFQMRRATDRRRIGWLWDEFPEGHPRRVAYISPASSAYRRMFIEHLKPAIDQLKPDAIHLDAGGALINDGNGLIEGMNSMEGIAALHKELIAAYPDVVWGGESTNEIIGQYNWLAQRWASDYPPHPMGNFLMNDQVMFYGFLDQPAPDEPEYVTFLRRYEAQGVLPAVLVVSDANLGADRTRTFDLMHQLRRWQEKQYRPDWDTSWDSKVFRMKSADGQSTAVVETEGNFVRLIEDGAKVYERVRNANSVETPHFIKGWPAYNETTLFGLDPSFEYWLTPDPYRPNSLIHIEKLPENYRLGNGSLTHERYGYFEVEPVQTKWFDFVARMSSAKTGVRYDRDYPVVNGAMLTMGRAIVGGKLRNGVLISLPPLRNTLNGATFIEYQVAVPKLPRVTLAFEAGIADSAGKSDGMLFGVQINGATMWKQIVQQGDWLPGTVDLTPYAGTTVTIRFLTHSGMYLNPAYDYGCWGGLQLQTSSDYAAAPIQLNSPRGVPPKGFSPELKVDLIDEKRVEGRVDLPGKFAVFNQEPPGIALGESLFDFPYEVWKSYYGGLPELYSIEGSGNVEASTSGGITRPLSLIAIPPRNGNTIITSAVRIPEEANFLSVEYGLTDPPKPYGPELEYTGMQFSVQINGDEVFSEEVRSAGWHLHRVDLTPYRGKRILIQLKTDALKLSLFDWGRWADLTVQ